MICPLHLYETGYRPVAEFPTPKPVICMLRKSPRWVNLWGHG